MRSERRARTSRAAVALAVAAGIAAGACARASSSNGAASGTATVTAARQDTLRVDHAGSLEGVMKRLAERFEAAHPAVAVVRRSGGSVDLARRVAADSAGVPDVLALADYAVIPRLLVPAHATWYVAFARNAMVLAYADRSAFAGEITAANWSEVLRRPGVRIGHGDPARDPGGYRASLVFVLAERARSEPGLAAGLERNSVITPPAPNASFYDALRAGALDYVVTYRSSARSLGFRFVELPPAVNLSDPALAAEYAEATLRVPSRPGAGDSLTIRGEPIVYGATVPTSAHRADLGGAFVSALLGADGRAALEAEGFLPIAHPERVRTR